jgi:hypothetical protein
MLPGMEDRRMPLLSILYRLVHCLLGLNTGMRGRCTWRLTLHEYAPIAAADGA